MPLVLKIMLVDTDTGAHGEARVDLKPDAVRLTRHSFMNEYCGPTLAVAWDAMVADAQAQLGLPTVATVQ